MVRIPSKQNTKDFHSTRLNGEIAMLKLQLRAIVKDCIISRPTTEVRYDAIIDDHGKLHRVQVKYCNGKSSHSIGSYQVGLERRGNRYTDDEVDAIVVYIPESDKLYWVPIEQCSGRIGIVLRLHQSKNNQTRRVNFAKDYEW